MSKYTHLIFDLDNTLWDFNHNATEALYDTVEQYKLAGAAGTAEIFALKYHEINEELWTQYRKGTIAKSKLVKERFYQTLLFFGVDNMPLSEELNDAYLFQMGNKTRLINGAIELLDWCADRFTLSMITNGFTEVQYRKVNNSGLDQYFTYITTSEEAGALKPNREIFDKTLEKVKKTASETLMIGDDYEADIIGAQNSNIDQIFFNFSKKPENRKATYKVNSLFEIKDLLEKEELRSNQRLQ